MNKVRSFSVEEGEDGGEKAKEYLRFCIDVFMSNGIFKST